MAFGGKCPFRIDLNINHIELSFIKTGVETLVGQIYDAVSQIAYHQIECQKQKLKEITGVGLIEKDNACKILKVGSFYEGTKLFYPDEFDFILIFGTFYMQSEEIVSHTFEGGSFFIYDAFEAILTHRHFVFSKGGAALTLVFHKIDATNCSAIKLEFAYYKHSNKEGNIYVDVVPAFKILDELLEFKTDKLCCLPEFRKYIADTGSFLITRYAISFTESEVEFMRCQLSQKHVHVYKLLKYLINGENDGEKLKELCCELQIKFVHISTYKIKTNMMFHQSTCVNDNDSVMKCICDVICDVYRSWESRRWRNLVIGLDDVSEYCGNYRNYHRCRRYRVKGKELLVSMLKELTSPKKRGSDYEKILSLEPWSVSMLREVDVKYVMEGMIDEVEVMCS